MSYELNIISVGQEKAVSISSESGLLLRNETECEEVRRYFKIWPVFCHTKGILYSIEKEVWEGYFSSFPVCDGDFEHPVDPGLLPDYLEEEARENLTPLIIAPQYYSEVERFIQILIQGSPQKTILFLARYEGGDYEIFSGAYTTSQFLQKLRTNQILFNVCYIVTEREMT